MALVIPKTSAPQWFVDNLLVQNAVDTAHELNGVVAMTVKVYPAQGEFVEGATLMVVEKPFFDFAKSCGEKGAMTAAMIQEAFPAVDAVVAEALAADFAIFYGNYMVIGDKSLLLITAPPIDSINDLMPVPEPVVEEEPQA